MPCEICGADKELFRTLVEDTELKVCEKCSSFGKVLSKVKTGTIKQDQKKIIKEKKIGPEILEVIVSDYAEIIKSRREKLNLKQEDFAKSISEKVSLVHKIESGIVVPSIALARKLEKALNIKLVEQQEIKLITTTKPKSESMTLGDVVRVRKR